MRSVLIHNVTDQTYLRMKLLCLGHGLTMAKTLQKMVDDWYEKEKNIPDKGKLRIMKRFVKKYKLTGGE